MIESQYFRCVIYSQTSTFGISFFFFLKHPPPPKLPPLPPPTPFPTPTGPIFNPPPQEVISGRPSPCSTDLTASPSSPAARGSMQTSPQPPPPHRRWKSI